MVADRLRLAPAPAWRETLPALVGLAAAVLVAVAGITIEAALAKDGMKPGAVLGRLPLLAAAACAVAALRTHGGRHEAFVAATVSTLALFIAVHPKPETWMYPFPILAAAAAFALRLAPATRMVVALPVVAGLLVLLEVFARQAPSTPTVLLVVGLCLLALWFLVPQESGWRRIPFLVHLGVSLVVPVAFAAVLLGSLVTVGISTPRDWDGFSGGPDLGTLLGVALLVGYPYGVWRLWIHPKARAFLLPTLPLPRFGPPPPPPGPAGRNA